MADETPPAGEIAARDAAFAEALAAFGPDDAPSSSPRTPPAASKTQAQETDEKDDPNPDPDPDDKPKDDKAEAEPEKLSKGFQKLRKDRKALGAEREALAQAKAQFQAQQHQLVEQAREGERARRQLDQITTLLARAQDGDQEALAELRLDVGKMNEGFLRHSTGDAKIDRLERELRALREQNEKRTKEDEEQRTQAQQAAEEERLYRQAVEATLGAADKTRVLKSYGKERIVEMAEALAQRYALAKKPVPHPQRLVEELERTLVEELRQRRSLLDDDAPPPADKDSRGPATLTSRDKGARGSKTPRPYSRDAEAQVLAEILAGKRSGDDDEEWTAG